MQKLVRSPPPPTESATALPCIPPYHIYQHTLYIILDLPYNTLPCISPYHTIIPYISPYIYPLETLPCISLYHTIIPYISPYIYPPEHPTLHITLPYHHTLYITLHLPSKTPYPSGGSRILYWGGRSRGGCCVPSPEKKRFLPETGWF